MLMFVTARTLATSIIVLHQILAYCCSCNYIDIDDLNSSRAGQEMFHRGYRACPNEWQKEIPDNAMAYAGFLVCGVFAEGAGRLEMLKAQKSDGRRRGFCGGIASTLPTS